MAPTGSTRRRAPLTGPSPMTMAFCRRAARWRNWVRGQWRNLNTLRNNDGRYSPTHSGSQAATYGIYQVPMRWSAGYAGEGMGLIFQGRIQRAPARESTPDVTVTCYGYDHDIQQQRPETIALAGMRADEAIAVLANAISFSPTSLERGYTVIPWYYADGDDCLAEMREIAECEGGVLWVDPQDKTLKFWTWAHWVGASSVATIGRSVGTEEVQLAYDYAAPLMRQ